MKTLSHIPTLLALAVAQAAMADEQAQDIPWMYTLPDWVLISGAMILCAGLSLLLLAAYRRWQPGAAPRRSVPIYWTATGAVLGALAALALEGTWKEFVFEQINGLPPSSAGGNGLELFLDTPETHNQQATRALAVPREATRTRFVRANIPALNAAKLKKGDSLALNLFNDATFKALIKQVDNLGPGKTAYVGRLSGIQLSTVNMVVENGVMMANVVYPDGAYQIRYAGNGLHGIHQIDQGSLPPENEPLTANIPHEPPVKHKAATSGADAAADDGSQIDVMVVYDDAAERAAGGTAAIGALIDLAISETNTNYANSGINQRLNLAHKAKVSYDETNFNWSNTLYRLTNKTDGYMDEVHSLRDTYNADATVFLVANPTYCGLGWMMDTVSAWFSDYAFSVVNQSCATGYYSFGHELGHNMGARHDWYVDSTLNSPYTYNKGYVNPQGHWRTVMAYNNKCSDQGFNCTRLPYWSNPLKTYDDKPIGSPEGTDVSCKTGNLSNPECDADNAKVLNDTAYTVANFRVSSSCKVSATPTAETIAPEGATGLTLTISAPASCQWTVASDNPWLTFLSDTTGQGNGSVQYQAEANADTLARTAKITVSADNTVTANITQTASSWISAANPSVTEGAAGTSKFMVFPLTLSKKPTQAVTLNYTTQDGTATAGSDYAAASGTVTFLAGQIAQSVRVQITGDNVQEPTETLSLVLSNPASGYQLKTPTATGTIVNYVVPGTVSVGNAKVAEGPLGTSSYLEFGVSLNRAPLDSMTVNFATQNGTALAGADYAAQTGTLTFGQGQTSQTVRIEVTGDNIAETAETLKLVLSNPGDAYILKVSTATGTIANFVNPAASIAKASIKEGKAGVTSYMPFKITLSKAPTEAITVDYATQDGTATAGSDYTAQSGTLTFAAGQTTQTVMVQVIGDSAKEPAETFSLALGNPACPYILKVGSAIGTIANDD